MKIRLTIMTENDKPVEILGENPEEKIKKAWDVLLTMMSLTSENNDTAYVESVEVVRNKNDV
jgi:hypothetical protein